MSLTDERKTILGKSKTEVTVDRINKKFTIKLYGQFDLNGMKDFFNIYANNVKKIMPDEYDLIIDCKLLGVFQSNLVEDVKKAYQDYRSFKSITIINPLNFVGKMQIQRIAKEGEHIMHTNFIDAE